MIPRPHVGRVPAEETTDLYPGLVVSDDGKKTLGADRWFDRCMAWQDELVGLMGRVDPELTLRPIGDAFELLDEDEVRFDDRQHRCNVSAVDTQVRMVERWMACA